MELTYQTAGETTFKCRYVVNGQTVGFGSRKCRLTDDGIEIGNDGH